MADGAELEAVKEAQQKIWSTGDFAMVASHQVIVGELLCESLDIVPGEQVLDVACGSGNTTLSAARRAWGNATGVDYVPELLDRGRERAAAERLEVEFIEGDAEDLPFEAGSFDVVASTFGAMFAPDQRKAAGELLRVCRSGGRIGMSNWTPDGVIGKMFATVGKHAPPPVKLDPPSLWGTEERLRELFGDQIASLEITKREYVFRYRSPEHWLEFFRTYFGPTMMAFARLDEGGQEAFANDLLELWRPFDRGGDRAMIAPAEYLEVVAVRV